MSPCAEVTKNDGDQFGMTGHSLVAGCLSDSGSQIENNLASDSLPNLITYQNGHRSDELKFCPFHSRYIL